MSKFYTKREKQIRTAITLVVLALILSYFGIKHIQASTTTPPKKVVKTVKASHKPVLQKKKNLAPKKKAVPIPTESPENTDIPTEDPSTPADNSIVPTEAPNVQPSP
jgi:hypothetical protein